MSPVFARRDYGKREHENVGYTSNSQYLGRDMNLGTPTTTQRLGGFRAIDNLVKQTINTNTVNFVCSIPRINVNFSFMYEPTNAHLAIHVLYY